MTHVTRHPFFAWRLIFCFFHLTSLTVYKICALQALGDLVESIAGAILIDSRLNLDEVWRVFKPILSPIVTPDKLELPPLRELILLCDSLGFFIKESCLTRGETVFAELSVQLEDTYFNLFQFSLFHGLFLKFSFALAAITKHWRRKFNEIPS